METLSALGSLISIINGSIDMFTKIDRNNGSAAKQELTIIKAWKVLDKVFSHQLQGHDIGAIENLVKTLIENCYDAEDLLDKGNLRVANPRKRDVAKNILKIVTAKNDDQLKILDEFSDQLSKILLEETHQSTATQQSNVTEDPYISRDLIIGRNDDMRDIIEKLLSIDDNHGFSIIGMCGLGKTLLAKTIFNNQRIAGHFSSKIWCPVSDGEFVWKKLKTNIKQQVKLVRANELNPRYLLIVFDNVLSMRCVEWDKFTIYREQQEKLSIHVRIIITTRKPRISELTCTKPHYLGILSVDDCENVIRQNVNLYTRELSEPLLGTVRELAKKCEGLPWVAERFGCVLVSQREDIEGRDRLWHTLEFKTAIFPQLKHSYINMDSDLRRCLAYFSLFPTNHHFNIDDLVHLWVGECFVQLKGKTSLKQIKKYVDDLIERSILQASGTMYKLHCFGQDFSMLAASGTCLQLDQGVPSSSDMNARHVSFLCKKFMPESWSQLGNLRKIRTFLSIDHKKKLGKLGIIPPELYESVSRLRVLSLKGTNVKELPTFTPKLKHLRYLDISFTFITVLPKSFSKLFALQFFKRKGTKLSHLPKEFHKLINLRYVDWEEHDMRELRVPCLIGKISCLESLPLFNINEEEGHSIRELKDMNNLQGSICIENLQRVADRGEAKEAMLHKKHGLERIELKWTIESVRDRARDKDILKGLKPHNKLKELKIMNYGGEKLPQWISKSMIEKVHLVNCSSCYLPALGKMKNLKTLVLEYMGSVTLSCRSDGDTDRSVRFRSLESMKFHEMHELNEWAGLEAHGDLPLLTELKFDGCTKIEKSLPFIEYLLRSKPTTYISNDGQCMRCNGYRTCHSSVACPHS